LNTVNLYCVGGTGANIGGKFAKFHNDGPSGFASIKSYFIDTSRSNLPDDLSDDRVFLYKDDNGELLDGNGKLRSSNYSVLSENSTTNRILNQFKPTDLNIIIHSGGGGTGSVAGPLIAKELIAAGHNVVVILIGSGSSKIDLKNTLNTLRTYESLSEMLKTPINVLYRENTSTTPRGNVDSELVNYIYLLSAFFGGKNHGLDTADLRNFLHYNRVTSYEPRLTALDFFSKTIKLYPDTLAISAVTLIDQAIEVDHGDVLVDFQVTGVTNAEVIEMTKDRLPLHVVTLSGFFPSVVARLSKQLAAHEEKGRQISMKTIAVNSDKKTNDGLIL